MMVERSEVQPDDPKHGSTDTPELDQATDKFQNDYEKLDKSYKALQGEFTRKAQELAELKKQLGSKPDASDEWKTEDKEEVVKGENSEGDEQDPNQKDGQEQEPTLLPGFDSEEAQEISNYAWEHRELTEEHYEKLAEKGYSRELVDEFMEGQFARAEGMQQAIFEAGGGEKNVERMFAWARDNLSDSEIEKYDSKFDAGGADAIMAMENLKAKYDASGKSAGGKTVQGANSGKGESTSKYNSTAELMEDMSNPKYASDPAFQAKVQEKLSRSDIL